MIQITLFKNDLKQIVRDTIMTLLLFAPLLLIVVFKLLELFLVPYLAMLKPDLTSHLISLMFYPLYC
jgi:hypothetical protein